VHPSAGFFASLRMTILKPPRKIVILKPRINRALPHILHYLYSYLRGYIARKHYYPYASIIIHNVINTNANAAHPQPYYHRVMTAPKTKRLYYGDNLHVLREHINDESVDLIYLDPPFNSKRDYNLLFKTPKGMESDAQITAFEDSWH
jgi:hypothetical protein